MARWLALAFVLLTGFENCSTSSNSSTSNSASSSNQVVTALESTSGYSNIVFDPKTPNPSYKLTISLGSTSQLSVQSSATGNQVTCSLDSSVSDNLIHLLSSSSACKISPAPGTITCEAIAIPDIELSNGNSTLSLAPVTCGSGIELCGNADESLRLILTSLETNLPAGCAGIQ